MRVSWRSRLPSAPFVNFAKALGVETKGVWPVGHEKTFRHSAGFGKRIEFWVIAEMMKYG
jgi:hypothetical protein